MVLFLLRSNISLKKVCRILIDLNRDALNKHKIFPLLSTVEGGAPKTITSILGKRDKCLTNC